MQLIIGIFLIFYGLQGVWGSVFAVSNYKKMILKGQKYNPNDSESLDVTTLVKEYQAFTKASRLNSGLMSLGISVCGLYFILGGNLTITNMIGSILIYLGYVNIIRLFFSYDDVNKTAIGGIDAAEYLKTIRLSLIFGLLLAGVGIYLLL